MQNPASKSFSIDSAKLWNNAPAEITNALTLHGAKREIKKYCKNLELRKKISRIQK